MTTPTNTTISNQIYLSRDSIRTQIIEYMQYYLELENVDLVKSSFLSFLIDTLSTLTSNLLFYSTSNYKEFFLTTAQLPESIFNLSAFLGYNTTEAKYSTANVLINIPLTFEETDVNFNLAENFKFIAGDIEFLTYYSTDITVTDNSTVSVVVTQDSNKIYNLPISIDSTSAIPSFSFVLPVRQYKEVIQEFQIDEDIELYQFITVDVPLSGKVSTMVVEVRDPGGSSWRTYTEFNSVYLMSGIDYGYVSRTAISGRRLTFGNGIIGVQPLPGSTIRVTTNITEGENGNVISGSINRGDRMYLTDSFGVTKVVSYSVTNTSPATGGEDEESIEEIRNNAISGLVALKRLTSEYDYMHAGEIITDSPIASGSIPVLKRSDVKVNEIQLFTTIEFGSTTRTSATTGEEITEAFVVPTRNAKYETTDVYIPRETIVTIGEDDYYTLFDLSVDLVNASAAYTYIMYQIENVPILTTSYGLVYDILCSKLTVQKTGTSAVFDLSYNSTEVDYDLCSAELKLVNSSLVFNMVNNSAEKKFTYSFTPYTVFPDGDTDLEFTIYTDSGNPISTYSSNVTFRKSLNDFMMSNVSIDSTSSPAEITIYDVPVIEKTYYDSIVKKDFELDVLQKMMTVMDFKSYRMLTDFTNLKFTNTIGTMQNMNLNPVTKPDVIDIDILIPPSGPTLNDRYIVGNTDSGLWANKYGKIAQCTDAGLETWYYFSPITNDIIYVSNKSKKYIYNGNKWILMDLQIPLDIEIEVFKASNYYGTDIQLVNLIKDTLLTEYSTRFGPNVTLYRSEIIRTIQQVTGVGYCNLIKPTFDVFFNFELTEFTQDELLEYSPEYVYFNADSISIRIYS